MKGEHGKMVNVKRVPNHSQSTMKMTKSTLRTRQIILHPVHGYPISPTKELKVSKRNARERDRVKTVNQSFELLKKRIPSAASSKRMSKVNIICHAMSYIRELQCLLESQERSNTLNDSPFYNEERITYQYSPPCPISSSRAAENFRNKSSFEIEYYIYNQQNKEHSGRQCPSEKVTQYVRDGSESKEIRNNSDHELDVIDVISEWQHK